MNQLANSNKPAGRTGGGRSRALDVDHYVSLRIRQRRIMLGLTQKPVTVVIEDVAYHGGSRTVTLATAGATESKSSVPFELARNFAGIGNRKHQDALCNLARVLANGELAE